MNISIPEIIVILFSYGLGCITMGYYLVMLQKGLDIRKLGTGSVGARNAGRVLGRIGFVTTFLFDFAKGWAAVLIARYFGLDEWGVILALIAVVVGHIWPFQLGFHGGKGIATSLGALMGLDFPVLLDVLILFAVTWLVTRNFTLGGMLAFTLLPVMLKLLNHEIPAIAGTAVLAVLVIAAHRKNIRNEILRIRTGLR